MLSLCQNPHLVAPARPRRALVARVPLGVASRQHHQPRPGNRDAPGVDRPAAEGRGVQDLEGICEGGILYEKQGEQGFGYDPIFKPLGYTTSFAEMTLAEKGQISHRGKAVARFVEFLTQ